MQLGSLFNFRFDEGDIILPDGTDLQQYFLYQSKRQIGGPYKAIDGSHVTNSFNDSSHSWKWFYYLGILIVGIDINRNIYFNTIINNEFSKWVCITPKIEIPTMLSMPSDNHYVMVERTETDTHLVMRAGGPDGKRYDSVRVAYADNLKFTIDRPENATCTISKNGVETETLPVNLEIYWSGGYFGCGFFRARVNFNNITTEKYKYNFSLWGAGDYDILSAIVHKNSSTINYDNHYWTHNNGLVLELQTNSVNDKVIQIRGTIVKCL